MKKFNFWKKYLVVTSYFTITVGAHIAFFKTTILFTLFSQFIDPVFWPNSEISEGTQNFKGFLYSIMGALMILVGINLYFIVKHAFHQKNKWAWNCILISTLTWFLIDEAFSIYYKVYFNVVFNLFYFLILLLPLIFTRKHFTANVID